MSRLNVGELIYKFLDQIYDQLEMKNIKRYYRADCPDCFMIGNKRGLHQIFLNLFNNAIDALSHSENPKITVTLLKGAKHVTITIIDNGCGIDEKDLQHIYTPLFTKKGKGSGLGLAIVKKIVTQMNGSIDIKSTMGEGTTVKLIFTLTPDEE